MAPSGINPTENLGVAAVVPRWYRVARAAGFVLLAVITLLGVRELVTGDTAAVARFWTDKLPWLPLILLLSGADLLLEGVAWVAVCERFGLRVRDRLGATVYLSGNAGLLMPAQLGRLIRADSLVRTGRGAPAVCIKAEASAFVLDALSVATLLVGLGLWRVHPAAAPFGAALVVAVFLYLGHRVADRLTGTRLGLPHRFWWHWQSVAIVSIQLLGWATSGFAFFVLVADLPGNLGLWDALFFAPGSAVLGAASGLPGGLGATEGLLGTALRLNDVPAAHLVAVVSAFRLVTFWLRLPIGWLALAVLHRRKRKRTSTGIRFAEDSPTDARTGKIEAHVERS